MKYVKFDRLTRSLPRDVYIFIRRKNDHPGGQGRIYSSNLILFSAHLSKPGHRRGCCCMSPRCLLRQFVGRCLLSCAFSLRKQFFYASCGFCLNGGKQRCQCSQMRHKLVRAVRLIAFVTTAIEERAGFLLLKARATNDGGVWLGEESGDGGAWGKNDHTAAVNEDFDIPIHSERSPSLRRGIVGTNVRASSRVKHCESAVRRTSKQECCHSDPVGVASKIFSRRVATINRVELRGPAQPENIATVSEFRADVLLLVVVRASRRCSVCDSVVASGVVADGAEKTGQKSCFRRTMLSWRLLLSRRCPNSL